MNPNSLNLVGQRDTNFRISSGLRHSVGHFQACTEADLKSLHMETPTAFCSICDEIMSKLVFLLLCFGLGHLMCTKSLFKHLNICN